MWAEETTAGWGGTACSTAWTSHDYFWDPLGPPAPTMPVAACIPEVTKQQVEASLCKRCASHKFHEMLFHKLILAFLAALILTCVVGSIPDMFSPFIWQCYAHNFIHRSGLLRDCICGFATHVFRISTSLPQLFKPMAPFPCRQCRFVGGSRVASRKIPRRSFRPVWSTFCIAFFAAHIFCHLNVLSTEQIAHGISESAGVKQALRRMARKSKYISPGKMLLVEHC